MRAYSHPLPPTVLVLAKMDILLLSPGLPQGKKLQLAIRVHLLDVYTFGLVTDVENINMLSGIYIAECMKVSLSCVDYIFSATYIILKTLT